MLVFNVSAQGDEIRILTFNSTDNFYNVDHTNNFEQYSNSTISTDIVTSWSDSIIMIYTENLGKKIVLKYNMISMVSNDTHLQILCNNLTDTAIIQYSESTVDLYYNNDSKTKTFEKLTVFYNSPIKQ